MHLRIKNSQNSSHIPSEENSVSWGYFRKSWTQQFDRNWTWGPAGLPEDSTGLGVLSQTQFPYCEMGRAGALSNFLLSLLDTLDQSLSSLRFGIWYEIGGRVMEGIYPVLRLRYLSTVLYESIRLYCLLNMKRLQTGWWISCSNVLKDPQGEQEV